MNKIILGGGLVGLIVKYFNPQFLIFTKQLGGQFSNKFPLGPRYLHYSKESEEFIRRIHSEFDIHAAKQTVKVGYFCNSKLSSKCTPEQMRQYYFKSRGLDEHKECSNNLVAKGIMSNADCEYTVYKFDFNEFVEAIFKKYVDDFRFGTIEKIDITRRILTYTFHSIQHTCTFENLISAIPLNEFLKYAGESRYKELQFSPIYFDVSNTRQDFLDSKFDYIYCPDKSVPYYRATVLDKEKTVYEYSYKHTEYPHTSYGDVFMKLGHVIDTDLKFEFPDVHFVGRMGKWKHKERLDKVIEDAKNLARSIQI